MTVSDKELLGGAIMFGERSADLAMKYAVQVRDLRRVMWRTLQLMRIGKIHEAKKVLEETLTDDNTR